MGKPLQVDLFAEDRAHEKFLLALIERIAREHGKSIRVQVRSSRGGHGRAISELVLYQKSVMKGAGILTMPDLLVIAIDANCNSFHDARQNIRESIGRVFKNKTVIACPDPHIERWYLADRDSFARVVGVMPRVGKRKCEKDFYKAILSNAVESAGHVPTLGGIEFAQEIVMAMDLYRAARLERSLKHFLREIKAYFKSSQ